jgi:hypothetical protein
VAEQVLLHLVQVVQVEVVLVQALGLDLEQQEQQTLEVAVVLAEMVEMAALAVQEL